MPVTLAAVRQVVQAERDAIVAFLRSGPGRTDDAKGFTIEDYDVPLDALALANPTFGAV